MSQQANDLSKAKYPNTQFKIQPGLFNEVVDSIEQTFSSYQYVFCMSRHMTHKHILHFSTLFGLRFILCAPFTNSFCVSLNFSCKSGTKLVSFYSAQNKFGFFQTTLHDLPLNSKYRFDHWKQIVKMRERTSFIKWKLLESKNIDSS